MENKKLVRSITSRDEDFAKWYSDLCLKAELMDYSDAKGFIIYRPYGYQIWELIQSYLDNKFKETGHENVYMPMLIPENLLNKEKDHVVGFAPECAIVETGGNEKLAERLFIRPTSETLFCSHFSKIVSSYRDLPKKYNQWCSVVRWEKTTRPFLRGKEFLWQEGHTIHSTEEEARKETLDMLEIYKNFGSDVLAIPFVTGIKTEKEKFAGAKETYTIEALMHDGKALQSGTTHYFGDGFSKAFNIAFTDRDNQKKNPFGTSWGLSTRLIGALIMVHGDDEGLVLPPYVAPTQVVIIPIKSQNEEVVMACNKIYDELKALNIRVKLDMTDRTPGWKYAEYEMKGVPVRIEVGPRDLENSMVSVVLRHTREKSLHKLSSIKDEINDILKNMHNELLRRAEENIKENTRVAYTYDEFKNIIKEKSGYVKMMWCGNVECENKIKEETTATSRCIPFKQEHLTDTCPVCGKKAEKMVLFAKAY